MPAVLSEESQGRRKLDVKGGIFFFLRLFKNNLSIALPDVVSNVCRENI